MNQWQIGILAGDEVAHMEPEGRAELDDFLCNQPIDFVAHSSIKAVEFDAAKHEALHVCGKLDKKIFKIRGVVPHQTPAVVTALNGKRRYDGTVVRNTAYQGQSF